MRGLATLLLLLAGVCAAVPPTPRAAPRTGAALYRRTLAGTAWVLARGQGKGTGWVVDRERRLLVTCYHVVGDNDTCLVVFPWYRAAGVAGPRRLYLEHLPELQKQGIAVTGRVLKRSKDTDLALIEVESLPAEVRALPLATASAGAGQRVHLVGNRYDAEVLWTAAAGRVRGLRTLREGYFSAGRQLGKGARVLLAGVPINEGDSGAALVNERGEVVGVAAAVAWEAHGGGLFVDCSAVRSLLGVSAPAQAGPGATVYRQALRGVVLVQYTGGGRFAGVLLDRRLVLTTAEAVAREKTLDVTFAALQAGGVVAEAAWYRTQAATLRRKGYRATGVVLAVDPRRNLALLEVDRAPEDARALRLARGRTEPGDTLHLITHPARLEVLWVYAAGTLRQRDHVHLGQAGEGADPAVLLVQAPLSESEGGGPALDDRGELAGLVSGKVAPQQQIAHVVDLPEVRAFLDEVRPLAIPNTAAERVRRAARFVEARQLERALDEFTAALALDARCAAALAGRAWVQQLRGAFDRALADADRALVLAPHQAEARCARAAAWLGLGQPARAVAECDQVLRGGARSALACALRARANLELGRLDRAAADADEALWLDAKLPLAYLARGQVHARRNELDRALENFSRAVALAPWLAEAYRRRGDVAWVRSDPAAALADYDRALKETPGDALALLGRGRAHLARAEHDRGLADLDEALRLRPDLAEAYVDRGGEKVRRAWVRTGPADLLEGLRRRPGLLPAVLAEVERRAADLTPADEAEVYRRVLQGVRQGKLVAEGLAAAGAEKDVARKARMLRQVVATLRSKLEER